MVSMAPQSSFYSSARYCRNKQAFANSSAELSCGLIACRLPVGQLTSRLAPCVKALLAVLKELPEHSVAERKQIIEYLDFLVRRCFLRSSIKVSMHAIFEALMAPKKALFRRM